MSGKSNPKLRKNGGEGTFVGNVLRSLEGVAPEILSVLGTVSGIPGLTALGEKIRGTDTISDFEM